MHSERLMHCSENTMRTRSPGGSVLSPLRTILMEQVCERAERGPDR